MMWMISWLTIIFGYYGLRHEWRVCFLWVFIVLHSICMRWRLAGLELLERLDGALMEERYDHGRYMEIILCYIDRVRTYFFEVLWTLLFYLNSLP